MCVILNAVRLGNFLKLVACHTGQNQSNSRRIISRQKNLQDNDL